ncbi:Pectinesterase/pectinesterase inhibitor [Thalictrum thalictroides]|uniref:Pectinesterase n=1 Tax=Thalictrum thalictroides TaxID=46969 RepID=A0A7J6VTV4_THATH|nr:Pectinesterase/pectinesterase inhibitor [Thalictrum thalictroides]
MGDSGNRRKKIAIIGVSSLILVAMVVAVAVGVKHAEDEESNNHAKAGQIKSSLKAIKAICQPTDFKETCIESLQSVAGNTSNPSELVQASFQVAIKHIQNAAKKSVTLKELAKDKGGRDALRICQNLMDYAIEDLKHAFKDSNDFDITRLDEFVGNLKVWLSGSLTYQETCLDGFENTTGTAGEAMRKALKSSGEITRNALAIVDEINNVISSLNSPKRRLLSKGAEYPEVSKDGFPTWITPTKRRLLKAEVKPNIVVAKDGSGKYKTINEALKMVPAKNPGHFVIYVKAGVYAETVTIKSTNVMLIGDGAQKTKITGKKSHGSGYKTVETATVAAVGHGFIAKNIGFENTAGPDNHQAVALRVQSDKSIIYNCQIDGYQDSLYVHTHRQFYRDCTISGTIDFIFGNALAIFQNCNIVVRKPNANQQNHVTAHGRKDRHETSAIILQGCKITADPLYFPVRHQIKTFLGRPWKNFSRTIIMQTHMDDFIQPEGWAPWNGKENLDTCFYAEYQNKGPGADMSKRVKWRGIKKINNQQAQSFTSKPFFWDIDWVSAVGVPIDPGMMRT